VEEETEVTVPAVSKAVVQWHGCPFALPGDQGMTIDTHRSSPRRSMLKSKIHRATVTHADVDYEGSLTLDRDLLRAADILPFEEVHLWNVTRGTRLSTYAMEGQAGSGIVCVNGAAARLTHPGDLIIVATFAQYDAAAARSHVPTVILVDANNHIKELRIAEVAGPDRRPDC
jgi:aspartate 1-decarboxylase